MSLEYRSDTRIRSDRPASASRSAPITSAWRRAPS